MILIKFVIIRKDVIKLHEYLLYKREENSNVLITKYTDERLLRFSVKTVKPKCTFEFLFDKYIVRNDESLIDEITESGDYGIYYVKDKIYHEETDSYELKMVNIYNFTVPDDKKVFVVCKLMEGVKWKI